MYYLLLEAYQIKKSIKIIVYNNRDKIRIINKLIIITIIQLEIIKKTVSFKFLLNNRYIIRTVIQVVLLKINYLKYNNSKIKKINLSMTNNINVNSKMHKFRQINSQLLKMILY